MDEVRGGGGGGFDSWTEDLASLVEDTGPPYNTADPVEVSPTSFHARRSEYHHPYYVSSENESSPMGIESSGESLKDQVKGFLIAWGEILLELGRGCKDILEQNLMADDSYLVRKLGGPCSKVSNRLRFLNNFLPEDRDPFHAWSVVFFVFLLAIAVMSFNPDRDTIAPVVKKMLLHPPSASCIQLPDGRYFAYKEQGVPADAARFSLITPHSFLSSRLAGLPGVSSSLLEEFGVRLITYDLPGFGESDSHPSRNLNSSAMDMLHLADAVGVRDKFWVLCHASGCIHAWAALRYISNRVAGAAMLAPMVNPYEPRMTKEEMRKTWDKWMPKRKLLYSLARRFPKLLPFFYRRSFLSGKHDRIDRRLSFSLGKKDDFLVEDPRFEEFWHRDVEESVRQGSTTPFVEEALLQVSYWGFGLLDLQVQKKCQRRGILLWLKSIYNQEECELVGFLGPIHIWQGMDDMVVPPSMTEYIGRILPGATVYRLPNEGHFSYFFFCDECHRQIFSTLLGTPQGPIDRGHDVSVSEME